MNKTKTITKLTIKQYDVLGIEYTTFYVTKYQRNNKTTWRYTSNDELLNRGVKLGIKEAIAWAKRITIACGMRM